MTQRPVSCELLCSWTRVFAFLCVVLVALIPPSATAQTTAAADRPQFLPRGLLYRSYIAGEKEPRVAAQWLYDGSEWRSEASIGARLPLWRYGTDDPLRPEGWQVDVEGAAFVRIDVESGTDVDAIDFRTGLLLSWRRGRTAFKAGTYHISNHVGDEYLEKNPGFERIEYVRDSLIGGVTHDLIDAVSVYGELAYAYGTQGGAEPLELQFGIEYNPEPSTIWWGRPFAGFDVHLREEFGFGGNVNAVAGMQWRSVESGRALRWGVQYFNGKALQYSFFDRDEEWIGTGLWLDF